ncbi:MAG: serine/threonine-protein kinase, partial [Myxococcota bacterium]
MLAGRYSYVQELGRGGTGRVILVRDGDAGPLYAAKVVGAAEGARLRWEEELLRQVAHPRLARVEELLRVEARLPPPFGLPAGVEVLLQAHAPGQGALAALVQRPESERPHAALRIVHDALQALAALHGLGIVHGDVTPSNLVVDEAGRAVLVDLGLAGPPAHEPGVARGTPGLMAPEAWMGERSVATDLYGVGATLHALLRGAVPASPSTVGEAARRALSAPLRELPPGLPAAHGALVAMLTAPAPSERPASAATAAQRVAAAAAALGPAIDADPLPRPSPEGRARRLAQLPLLGRDAELEALVAALVAPFLREAEAGASWVQLRGPAGAGSTRLLREAAARAQRQLAGIPGALIPTYVDDGRDVPAAEAAIVRLSARTRAELARRQRAARVRGQRRVVVLEASEEEAALAGAVEITLEALSVADHDALVHSLLAPEPASDAVLARARELSGALPGRLCRLAAALVREGAALTRPEAWRAPGPDPELILPAGSEDAAARLAIAGGALGPEALGGSPSEASALRAVGLCSLSAEGRLTLRPDVTRSVWRGLTPRRRQALARGLRSRGGLDALAAAHVAAELGEDEAAEAGFSAAIAEARAAGQVGAAEQVAAAAVRRLPRCARLRFALADARRAAGRLIEARAALGVAEATFEGAVAAHAALFRAEIARQLGDRARALEERAGLPIAPSWEPFDAALRAWLAYGAGDLEAAAGAAQEAGALGTEVDAWVRLAQGQVAEARRRLEVALQSGALAPASAPPPLDGAAWSWRQRARLRLSLGVAQKSQGELAPAASTLRRARAEADGAGERLLAASCGANLGGVLLEAGQLGEGMAALEDASARLLDLGRDRDAARTLANLAHAQLWVGEGDLAARLATEAEAAATRAEDADAA